MSEPLTPERVELARRALEELTRDRKHRSSIGRLDRALVERLALRLLDTSAPMGASLAWLNGQLAATGGQEPISKSAFYRFGCRLQARVDQLAETHRIERPLTNLEALPVAAVAQRLALTPDQVQALIDGGRLATITLEGEVRVPARAIASLLGQARKSGNGRAERLAERIARLRAARDSQSAHPS